MYVKQLASFTEYLAGAHRNIDDICRHLVLNTFQSLNPRSIYLGEIDDSGSLCLRSSFGFKPTEIQQWSKVPLSSNIPITDAVNTNTCIILDSKDEFYKRYPDVISFDDLDGDWNTSIAIPVLSFGVFFLVLHGQMKKDSEFEGFLRSIGHLIVLSLREANMVNREKISTTPIKVLMQTSLTQRQLIITELIAKGYTNIEISKEIGYSESLIRQETIVIYAFLGISGRKELIRNHADKINELA